jgi:hypothetical protein
MLFEASADVEFEINSLDQAPENFSTEHLGMLGLAKGVKITRGMSFLLNR